MTSDNLPKPQRDARGLWAAGNSGNPSGRPKKVAEIAELAQQHAPEAFAKIVELMSHKDAKVALAAANSILDRAYGKPAQAVQARVETLDIGKLWIEAVKMTNAPPAKTIEGQAVQTRIVEDRAVSLTDGGGTPGNDDEGGGRW
jgi:hypothetical protein